MEAKVTKSGSMEAKGNVNGIFLRQNLKDSGRSKSWGNVKLIASLAKVLTKWP